MIEATTTDNATAPNEFNTGEFEKNEDLGELLEAALAAVTLPEEALTLSPPDVAFQALQQRLGRLSHSEPVAVALNRNTANDSHTASACMPGQAEPPAAYQAPSPSWWVGMARLE